MQHCIQSTGDVNDVPGGKTVMNVYGQVPVAVNSVLHAINASANIKQKPVAPPMKVIVVPIGPKGGAALLPFAVMGEWTTSLIKGKGLFVDKFKAAYGL